jgi:hypothetical protein
VNGCNLLKWYYLFFPARIFLKFYLHAFSYNFFLCFPINTGSRKGKDLIGMDENIVFWKCECGRKLNESLSIPLRNAAKENALLLAATQVIPAICALQPPIVCTFNAAYESNGIGSTPHHRHAAELLVSAQSYKNLGRRRRRCECTGVIIVMRNVMNATVHCSLPAIEFLT